jgi:hypothetical protein
MAAKATDNAQAVAERNAFDSVPNPAHSCAWPHLAQRCPRALSVAVRTRFFTRLSGGTVKFAPVSAKYFPRRADIDIDHVTSRQPSWPRNAMCNFFVDADARSAGESVSQLWRRFGIGLSQPL